MRPLAGLALAAAAALSPSVAPAEAPDFNRLYPVLVSRPTGAVRYLQGQLFELSYVYGRSPFGPTGGAALPSAALRLREYRGPIGKALAFLVMGSNAVSYGEGAMVGDRLATRDEIDAHNRQVAELAGQAAIFGVQLECDFFSDKLGGQVSGFDFRWPFLSSLFRPAGRNLVLAGGIQAANLDGPVLGRPGEPLTLGHANAGPLLMVGLLPFDWIHLSARWSPNVIWLFDPDDHASPLVLGLEVSPVEQVFLGVEATWSALEAAPRGLSGVLGVRL